MACSRKYLSTCVIPTRVSREGHAGLHASIYIPFAGLYFFSGEKYTFPAGRIAQNSSPNGAFGITKPDTFTKGFVGVCD